MNVVIYLRVSSEQREALQHYALENGWNIVQEYIDEARSAKNDEREDFQRMIADAQKPHKKFQAILVLCLQSY